MTVLLFRKRLRIREILKTSWTVFGSGPISLALIIVVYFALVYIGDALEIKFLVKELCYFIAVCVSCVVTFLIVFPARSRKPRIDESSESKMTEDEGKSETTHD